MGPPHLVASRAAGVVDLARTAEPAGHALGSGREWRNRLQLRKVAMTKPDDGPNEDEPTRPSVREAAANKTRAVTSATADVMRDAFDKVIESIDDAATRQQKKAAVKEEEAAAKQERKAEAKAQKAEAKVRKVEDKAQRAAAQHEGATSGEDLDPPAEP